MAGKFSAMQKFRAAIAGLFALLTAAASAQQFSNVPDKTVIGRIGTGTSSGPSQAIPFATLFAQAQISQLSGLLAASQFATSPGVLTPAMFANQPASTLFGNPSTSAAAPAFFTPGSLTFKGSPVTGDYVVIQDNSASGQLKYTTAGAIGSVGSVASINGATGVITGIDTNTLNSISAAYTIASTDCGKTIQANTGASPNYLITLPAVTGFDGKCQITVINADTVRGKQLSGFCSTMTSSGQLWPGQWVQLKIVNGAWACSNPGRWRNPSTVTIHVDKAQGNNANDGLAATTGAVQTAQQAWINAVYKFDTQGTTPIIAMACLQTHTVPLQMGGTPLGSNLIQLSPDGNCSFSWQNNNACIVIADLAELDLNLTFYGGSGSASFICNQTGAALTANVYLHNQVVLDLEGTPAWSPSGTNDNFLMCDGPCEYTIANGVTQLTAAGGNYVIYMNEGGKGTQSGAISATGSGGLSGGIYYLFGSPTMLILGTSSGGGWSSVNASKSYGGATLVTNGVTISGGTSKGTGTGRICTSLTDSTC